MDMMTWHVIYALSPLYLGYREGSGIKTQDSVPTSAVLLLRSAFLSPLCPPSVGSALHINATFPTLVVVLYIREGEGPPWGEQLCKNGGKEMRRFPMGRAHARPLGEPRYAICMDGAPLRPAEGSAGKRLSGSSGLERV